MTPGQRTTTTLALGRSGPACVNTPTPGEDTLIDTTQQNALIGLLKARRYRALALRDLGLAAENEAAITSATQLAIGQNMRQPALAARLLRTAAASADARGDLDEASSASQLSGVAFGQALPGTRPEAATLFLHAAQLQRLDRTDAALAECRRGAALLRELKSGIEPELVHRCLEVYAAARLAELERQPDLRGRADAPAELGRVPAGF